MSLEGNLGEIQVKVAKVKKSDVSSDALKVDSLNDDKKKALKEKFDTSEAGKEMKTKLESIKADTNKNAEQRRDELTKLMKDFFEVDSASGDEHIQRLLDEEGKSYLRIDSGDKQFDIALDGDKQDQLIQDLVDRSLEWSLAIVNEGKDDKEKIAALKYDREKLITDQTKKELDGLSKGIKGEEELTGRDAVTDTRNKIWSGKKGKDGKKVTFVDLQDSIYSWFSSGIDNIKGLMGGVKEMFGFFSNSPKKDAVAAAAKPSVWAEMGNKVSEALSIFKS